VSISRHPHLLVILLWAACGEVRQSPLEPDAAVDDPGGDPDAGTAACDPQVRQLPAIAITTGAGTCCGSSLAALVDGSGMFADQHDCEDATMWQSNGLPQAEVTIDLGAEFELTGATVWNTSQADGARGARNVQFLISRNNTSYFQIPGAPTLLARATTCLSSGRSFPIPNLRARFVRIAILDNYGAVNVGLGELAITGRAICE